MKILGIESSCDDTCAAVVENGRILRSNCIASSAEEQNLYGGVVPEIASRRHIEHISQVVTQALADAHCTIADMDGVAATFAPGLIGAVLVGLNFAKGISYSAQKPLIPVHHLRGHIAALYLTHADLKPPFLCLVASGGHSHIVKVNDYTSFTVLGRTVDDAAGEAFDKVSRTLGLGYPGGPAVSNLAKKGNSTAYSLPTPRVEGKYNVSFSGLKTAVINTVHNAAQKGEALDVAGLCASFEHRITGILAEKLLLAARDMNVKQICIAGGVAANSALRQTVEIGAKPLGAKVFLPEIALCGDNAAMIAAQGFYEFEAGHLADLTLNGLATLNMDY
ncbi:MAG: tRNA (adenosine(37)-N6)-threonylcarbamoyltransferase complex transferase subunit TsaD [Ruthenibacterium sp.]